MLCMSKFLWEMKYTILILVSFIILISLLPIYTKIHLCPSLYLLLFLFFLLLLLFPLFPNTTYYHRDIICIIPRIVHHLLFKSSPKKSFLFPTNFEIEIDVMLALLKGVFRSCNMLIFCVHGNSANFSIFVYTI